MWGLAEEHSQIKLLPVDFESDGFQGGCGTMYFGLKVIGNLRTIQFIFRKFVRTLVFLISND